MTTSTTASGSRSWGGLDIKALVGAGDRIALFVLPWLAVGVALSLWRPEWFAVDALAPTLGLAWALLSAGVVMWLWSVVLILTRVPRHELITTGPFRLVKHPLYTGVSQLVLPALGVLLGSWLGLVVGAALYVASRRYAPAEEAALAEEFGDEWDAYADNVLVPWL